MRSERETMAKDFTILAWMVSVALGTWFVGSGVWKIAVSGLDKFTLDIGNYQLPFIKPPLDAVAAFTVPWVEIVAGLCLAVGIWRRATLLVLAGLVAVFAICVGWAWSQGLNISCGCHGGDKPIHYWGKVAEFAGYYAALGFLWWECSRRRI
ncbi:MAG: DoxX family protein [Verrucomicrobia bacterium]|nr:DoxX family protein [Verrucomicrobiota bacterium]